MLAHYCNSNIRSRLIEISVPYFRKGYFEKSMKSHTDYLFLENVVAKNRSMGETNTPSPIKKLTKKIAHSELSLFCPILASLYVISFILSMQGHTIVIIILGHG